MFNRKNDQFNDVLNDCLERILVKGGSIEECLAQYPQQADELRPLLETALAARRQALAIKPRAEFKVKARYQFRAALQEAAAKNQHRPFTWQLRWAVAASLTLVLLTGSSVVAAASNSMPDSPLYQVKLATEQVQLFLNPAAEDKAELYAKLADRRVTEIVNMAGAGNVSLVELTTERLDNNLAMIANVSAGGNGGIFSWEGQEAPTMSTTTQTVTTTVGGGGTPTGTTSITKAGASNPPDGTLTVTTTVTKTVGGGGILATVTTGTTTSTVATQYDNITTTVPGATTETAVTSDGSSVQPCVNGDNLLCQLQQDSASNIAALYEALKAAPEEVKPALLQAIAVLENGYNNAINANAQ